MGLSYLQGSTSFPLVQLQPTAECLLLPALGFPTYSATTLVQDGVISLLNFYKSFLIDLLLPNPAPSLIHSPHQSKSDLKKKNNNLNHTNSLLQTFWGLDIIFWAKSKLLTMACRTLHDMANCPIPNLCLYQFSLARVAPWVLHGLLGLTVAPRVLHLPSADPSARYTLL